MTGRGTDDGELSVGGVATAGRVVGRAAKGLEAIVAVALVAMMSLTCIDVVGRYAFGKPIYGSAEMTQFLLGFLVFAALGLVSYRDAHIAIDVPGRWIARRIPRTHRLLTGLPSVVGLGLVTYELQRQAGQASGNARRTIVLEWPLDTLLWACAALCLIATLLQLLVLVVPVRHGEPVRESDDP